MITRIRQQIRQTAQRFALGSIGALMSLVGMGFLSASLLMLLLTLTDPITACAIMGGAFMGIGLLMVVAARSAPQKTSHRSPEPSQPDTEDMPPLAAAFMQGMAKGMAEGRRH